MGAKEVCSRGNLGGLTNERREVDIPLRVILGIDNVPAVTIAGHNAAVRYGARTQRKRHRHTGCQVEDRGRCLGCRGNDRPDKAIKNPEGRPR